jgi:predicted MFS family arabinose efflux permease
MGASIYAHVSGVAPPQMRSQAVSITKFSGDLATIFGGLLGGVLAHHAGVGVALYTIGGLQVATATVFLAVTLLLRQEAGLGQGRSSSDGSAAAASAG